MSEANITRDTNNRKQSSPVVNPVVKSVAPVANPVVSHVVNPVVNRGMKIPLNQTKASTVADYKAANFLDLEDSANTASGLMNVPPTVWRSTRQTYARNIDEVVLKNLPDKIKAADLVTPTKEQLHRLPENVAKGETPNTPLANRDIAMAKTTSILEKERLHSLPFGFLHEIRAIVPESPGEWLTPTANSTASLTAVVQQITDDSQMDNVIRSLEIAANTFSSTEPADFSQQNIPAANMASFSFLEHTRNPFHAASSELKLADLQPNSKTGSPAFDRLSRFFSSKLGKFTNHGPTGRRMASLLPDLP